MGVHSWCWREEVESEDLQSSITVQELPDTAEMSSPSGRSRTCSESSEGEVSLSGVRTRPGRAGVSYDVDGKFSYSQVMQSRLLGQSKTTVDENGKFSYFSADMRPVPPGWYDLDKSKHAVPMGWYQMGSTTTK